MFAKDDNINISIGTTTEFFRSNNINSISSGYFYIEKKMNNQWKNNNDFLFQASSKGEKRSRWKSKNAAFYLSMGNNNNNSDKTPMARKAKSIFIQ